MARSHVVSSGAIFLGSRKCGHRNERKSERITKRSVKACLPAPLLMLLQIPLVQLRYRKKHRLVLICTLTLPIGILRFK